MIPGRIPGRERWEVEDKLILSDAANKSGELKIYGGKAGEKVLEIFSGSTSIFRILATSTTVQLLGGATHPIQIGDAGSTSHLLNANDDLFVSGAFEVDGESHFDGTARLYAGAIAVNNQSFRLGTGSKSNISWSTDQGTENTALFSLGDTAKSIIFCDDADRGKDFDHAAQSNPTIFVQSATDPDSANDEWISFCHDVTDGVIATGSGNLKIMPAGITQIGDAGSTSQSLAANDDLFVSGKFEVDSFAFFDAFARFAVGLLINDDVQLRLGDDADSQMEWSTAQATAETLLWGLGDTAKSIILCDVADIGKDFDHAAQSNPTIFIHSAEDPDTANDEWISFCHTGTDGLIGCGSGTLNLGGTTVNFVHSTLTGATVTHDAYVTLEVAGVEKKFMLGS